jgi:hypothetical protein
MATLDALELLQAQALGAECDLEPLWQVLRPLLPKTLSDVQKTAVLRAAFGVGDDFKKTKRIGCHSQFLAMTSLVILHSNQRKGSAIIMTMCQERTVTGGVTFSAPRKERKLSRDTTTVGSLTNFAVHSESHGKSSNS